jgi:signal transduction histidine kinase
MPVFGDRDLLFEAIANLIDNALKHGGAGGAVMVAVRPGEIAVADRGPGIPPGERPHVLKRFYRLERSRSSEGNGLGLSLVAAVASLHGAQLAMTDNAPGLRIALRFPPAPAAAANETPARTRDSAL